MVGLPATTMRSPDLPVPREGQQARCILRKPAIEEAAPGSGYSLPLGAVAGVVGIESGVVSGVFNLRIIRR